MFGNIKPSLKIVHDKDTFSMKFVSRIFNREEKFTVGKDYEMSEMGLATFKVRHFY